MNSDIFDIEEKIEGVIVRWNMLPQGCTVVVGLSGGADSLTLAHFILKYAQTRHIHMIAAHINHGLRGKEADGDERFVAQWCGENHVELKILHADVRALAAEKSEGLEECGRNVRYDFFRSLCTENGKIATAHTLSDSTETVLMNLTKGAGMRGLRGIPPVRGNVVRPLIGITRAEVESYCAYYHLHFVTDSTNFEEDYERNKIRLGVVPVLREINPAFESAVFAMTGRLSADDECLDALAREQLTDAVCPGGYSLDKLKAMPHAILSRSISIGVNNIRRVRLESGHIDAVADIVQKGAGSVTVVGGIQCTVQGNTLSIAAADKPAAVQWRIPFNLPSTVLPDGRILMIKKLTGKELENCGKINNLLFNNLINYDTITCITSVRNRRNGDIFRPAGRGVSKSLKKLFNEAKIVPFLRGNIAMLESGGEIIWIEGFGVSQRACVTKDTQNIAEIIIKEFET
nr:tRNA lysidine(34) synthetase TilS [uncultured Caproiciproducens sp.]